MTPAARALAAAIDAEADPARAAGSLRFFKVGPGQYGEGDLFLGLPVPRTRALVRAHLPLAVDDAVSLLHSPWHEHRLAALLAMVAAWQRASRPRTFDPGERDRLHVAYVAALHQGHVNSWDLVDTSAEHLAGAWWRDHGEAGLAAQRDLARSDVLWERRVAMIASLAWIRAGEVGPTLRVATSLLRDEHDLMHKAVGWMLREVGAKVSREELTSYLAEHAGAMARTTLSYATEHLDAAERARYRAMPRR